MFDNRSDCVISSQVQHRLWQFIRTPSLSEKYYTTQYLKTHLHHLKVWGLPGLHCVTLLTSLISNWHEKHFKGDMHSDTLSSPKHDG